MARVVVLLGVLLMAAGCATEPTVGPKVVRKLAAMRYPVQAQRGPDVDVVVVREGDRIRLVNREARTFEGMQLWLNREYVGLIDQVAIGTENVVALRTCVNRYGEAFPVGTVLTPDQARDVVLAELYDPQGDVRYVLVSEF